jgi:hypothetical protein
LFKELLSNKKRANAMESVSRVVEKSVLFKTTTGHLGKATGPLEESDTIALLAGSDYPVILRKAGDDWRYLGPAYILGIMKGEGWPQNANTDDMQTFVLG